MKTCVLAFAVTIAVVLMLPPQDASAQVSPDVAADAIYTYFDADEAAFAVEVSACETGLGADIYNEGSGAYGILQMLPSTAYDMGYDYSLLEDPYYSAWAAKDLHDYMQSLGYWGFQPWSCAY